MFGRAKCVLVFSLFMGVLCADPSDRWQSVITRTRDLSKAYLAPISFTYSTEQYDDDKCFTDVLKFYEGVEKSEKWAVLMYDSWGSVPSGILSGNKYDLGYFDQCFVTEFSTQYCLVEVVISSGNSTVPLLITKTEILKFIDPVETLVGTCYPSSCSPHLTSRLYQTFVNESNVEVGPSRVKCYTSDSYNGVEFTSMGIFTICLFSLIAFLVVSSTIVELFVDIRRNNVPLKVWKAFSAYQNLAELCDTQINEKEVKFACLDGIKAISIVWVVIGHSAFNTQRSAVMNALDVVSWNQSISTIILLSTFNYAVDTFFVIGGFLAIGSIRRQFEHDQRSYTKKFVYTVPRLWFHRYIRLAPVVVSAVLFFSTIGITLGKGPLWNDAMREFELCYDNWWSTILFVQNYASAGKMCLGHLWYLAVDVQMFVVTTILVFFIHWKGLRQLWIAIVLILANLAYNLYWYLYFTTETTNNEREKLIYYPTHARMVSWLTGVILAFVYSIYSKKQERIKISSILRLIGYAFCMVVFGAIVVNTYFASSETSSIPIAVFNSFSRFLWSLGIAFIIFTSITNNGGSMNTFLSSPMWKPLSRLSFCIYVLHYVIQLMKIGQNRTTMYVDNFSLVAGFWSDFGITITVSIFWTLAFEIPFRIIERIDFRATNNVLPMAATTHSYVNHGADQELK